MTRRTALLLLFALVTLPGTGCYHLRNCINTFRANHPCLFPCYNSAYPMAAGCGPVCGPACGPGYDGLATYYPPAAGGPMPGAVFGPVQPIPNQPAPDPKSIPNPMK